MSKIDSGYSDLGYRLRKLRQHHNLTQVELGVRADVAQKDISAYERGRNTNIKVATLARLARALDVSLDYLVWGDDK